jgi:hypothetical protein
VALAVGGRVTVPAVRLDTTLPKLRSTSLVMVIGLTIRAEALALAVADTCALAFKPNPRRIIPSAKSLAEVFIFKIVFVFCLFLIMPYTVKRYTILARSHYLSDIVLITIPNLYCQFPEFGIYCIFGTFSPV